MIREMIQLILELATEYKNNRQRRRIEQLEQQLTEARDLAEYRDYVRRENERIRRHKNGRK